MMASEKRHKENSAALQAITLELGKQSKPDSQLQSNCTPLWCELSHSILDVLPGWVDTEATLGPATELFAEDKEKDADLALLVIDNPYEYLARQQQHRLA